MKQIEYITLSRGDTSITVEWERKKVKRRNLRVRRDGTPYASSPPRTTRAQMERFLLDYFDWMLGAKARQDMRHGNDQPQMQLIEGETLPIYGVNHRIVVKKGKLADCACKDGELILSLAHPEDAAARTRAFWELLRSEATRIFSARLAALYPHVAPIPPRLPALKIKWLQARWGSCTPSKNQVVLNLKLLLLHPAYLDYVIMHELCHFRVPNHSAAFYRELSRVYPDHARAKKQLALCALPNLPR